MRGAVPGLFNPDFRADTQCVGADYRVRDAVTSLKGGEELFAALAAHTPVGIFISSAEGGCVYVNRRWCELTGLAPEDGMGDGWAVALHPDDAQRVNREWAEAAAHGRDELADAIRTRRIPTGSGEVAVTASLGVVVLDGTACGSKDDALVAADSALYSAKSRGRDRVVLAP